MDEPLCVSITNIPDEFLFRGWRSDFEIETGVTVQPTGTNTAQALEQLRAGQCDLAIVARAPLRNELPLAEFERVELASDDFVLLVHADDEHPEVRAIADAREALTRREVVDLLRSLPDHELLTREQGAASYTTLVSEILHDDVVDGRVGGTGAKLRENESHSSIIGLLCRGGGRLSVTSHTVSATTLRPDMPLVEIEISDSARRSIFMIRPVDRVRDEDSPVSMLWDFFLRRRHRRDESSRGLSTILFTDLESSTEMTGRVGDERAQELIRTHNSTVRLALREHSGVEVKHTGDGIMASFSSAQNAVAAALGIRHDLAGLDVRARVGVNAGEPIAEDDDLFGTAVQLAARITDRARPGQVLVSDVVRQLCAGKTFEFTSVETVTLKGFDEPVTLYEVRATR